MITSSLMTEDALDRVASSDLDLEEINDVAKYVAMPPAPDMNRLCGLSTDPVGLLRPF